jgi:mRNA interferase RelE/StbE
VGEGQRATRPVKYQIAFLPTAEDQLADLDKPIRKRIRDRIDGLAKNPRDGKKLTGDDLWRVRVGKYRIVYKIEDDKVLITVVRIANRDEVYRRR